MIIIVQFMAYLIILPEWSFKDFPLAWWVLLESIAVTVVDNVTDVLIVDGVITEA